MIELKKENVFKVVSSKEEAEFLIGLGYTIVHENKTTEKETKVELEEKTEVTSEYSKMSMAELKAKAKELNVKGFNSLSKDALISLLESL